MPTMNTKTTLIALSIVILIGIGVIGASAYLFKGGEKQEKESVSVLPEMSEVIVSGRILDTSPSSLRAIHIIRDGDKEIFTVVLDDYTALIFTSGSQIKLENLRSGMRIRAIGKRGLTDDGMLAREVQILEE